MYVYGSVSGISGHPPNTQRSLTHTHRWPLLFQLTKPQQQEIYQNLTDFEEALLENPLSMFIKYTFLYLVAGKLDGRCVTTTIRLKHLLRDGGWE